MNPYPEVAMFGCDANEATLARQLAPRLGLTPIVTDLAPTPETVKLARGRRSISVGHRAQMSRATLRELSRMGVTYISTRSIGCNHLDVTYAATLGIRVENVNYAPDGVADYTVMQMLMLVRNAWSTLSRASNQDYRLESMPGRDLRDLTVGVIGTGRIGNAVINRLRGFGSDIRTHSRGGHDLHGLLRHSDVVSLHAPLTAATHHLLDHEHIDLMKPGALIVNTGRGPLIDTAALVDALEDGHLGGAALDVLEGEEGIFYADHRDQPLPHPLLERLHALPNVLITPHAAYHTERALCDTVETSLVHCLAHERKLSNV